MPERQSLPKNYDFVNTEERIYRWWAENNYFKPSNDPHSPNFDPNIKPFVISMPPPNVTGELHLGHAMFVSMEDLMIRYYRMKGVPTLWVPGTDHAGIATQLQVERMLRNEGISREEIGREEFLKHAWIWKEKFGKIITQQIRRLGASCDWERERFTLDEGLSRAVREAFVRLYEKGLIYRGKRLINWSPGLKTAVSDLEVEYSEEPGKLYYFKYMLADSSENGYIPVATTRPETILGDTAIAVHPEDVRYQNYIGKEVLVPILGRKIPVIADEYVKRDFGSGALKVTPGHDPNDFEISKRHVLPIISVLDEAARVKDGPYSGQDRYEARKNLWEDMRKAGLVLKEEDYIVTVPRSQRGGEVIEPMVSTQWFIKMDTLAEAALKVVRDGQISIVPERFTKVYYNWLTNIEDWCISRQLWWGHRIPVWYCSDCGKMMVERVDPIKCTNCGSNKLEQDPDVLDTWFSSALWPFSTLGWPDETPDYRYFYPTSYMETGYDILFFWVARMIMFGLEFTGEIPFHTVYLHGLIRDDHGRKMSKSYGNVIDPLNVMRRMGTDALRFTLLVGSTPGNDTNLSLEKVEANGHFVNKIWNVGRYVIGNLNKTKKDLPNSSLGWTLADSWIWARLQELLRNVDRLFQTFQYGEAGRQIFDFFWGDFADWYVEIAKLQIEEGVERAYETVRMLIKVMDVCLRLLHPFIPFVTEELWRYLRREVQSSPFADTEVWTDALIIASWPSPENGKGWEADKVASFELVQNVVRAIRNLRSEKNVKSSMRISAILVSESAAAMLRDQSTTIAALSRLDLNRVTILDQISEKPSGYIALVVGSIEIYLPLAEIVNIDDERARLTKDLAEAEEQVTRLENLLSSSFAEKAPQSVVDKERSKLAAFRDTVNRIYRQIDQL